MVNYQVFAPDPFDPRIRDLIKPLDYDNAPLCIIGAPFDEAVILGGGRAGAEKGPEAFRNQLLKYGTTFDISTGSDLFNLPIADLGNLIPCKDNISETHFRLKESLTEILKQGLLPVMIGGGHDLSFPAIQALAESNTSKIGVINVDAHLDVRVIREGKITSGTAFRRLIEELPETKFDPFNFVEIGVHGNLNSKHYIDYLKEKNSTIFTLDEINQYKVDLVMEKSLEIAGSSTNAIYLSIDLDAIAQCYAPGTSAPDAEGLTPSQIKQIAFLAGRNPLVKAFDIMELNPLFDLDNRTARLAVSIFISFLNGFVNRLKS